MDSDRFCSIESQLYNCTQSIWPDMGDSRVIEWKDAFNLTFHFDTEVNASRIEMVYCSSTLPDITSISIFPSPFNYTPESDSVNNSSLHTATIFGRGNFTRSLQMNIGQLNDVTCLNRLTFYNCCKLL